MLFFLEFWGKVILKIMIFLDSECVCSLWLLVIGEVIVFREFKEFKYFRRGCVEVWLLWEGGCSFLDRGRED